MFTASLLSYRVHCVTFLGSCSLIVAATGEESSDSYSQTDSDATPRDSLTEAMPCTTPPFSEFPETGLNFEFGRCTDKSAVVQLLEEELYNERASSELLATLVPILISVPSCNVALKQCFSKLPCIQLCMPHWCSELSTIVSLLVGRLS